MDKISLSDVSFECPYCGFMNRWAHHEGQAGISRELVYGYSEDGGCGKQLVLETHIEVTSNLIVFGIPSLMEK